MNPSPRTVLETWFQRVWHERSEDAIDELLRPDADARGLGGNVLVGPEAFKAFHRAVCGLFSAIEIAIDKSVEEGEWISALCTLRATPRAGGETVTITGSVLGRVVDGKLGEAYNHWDFVGLFAQLGLLREDAIERFLRGDSIV